MAIVEHLFLQLNFHISIFLHRYATGSARSDGMFLLCGGRDSLGAVYFSSPFLFCVQESVDFFLQDRDR